MKTKTKKSGTPATKKGNAPARNRKRTSTDGAKGTVSEIDTSRRHTKKELEEMPLEELALLAYRMTYDRVHRKRGLRVGD